MQQQINLYNPAFERKRDLLSLPGAVSVWALTLVTVIALIVAVSVRGSNMEKELRQAVNDRDAAQAQMNTLASQLAARKPNAELAAEEKRLEQAYASRQEVMSTLHEGVIGDTRGFSGHLQAFARQSFPGMWLTGLKVAAAGQDVVLEGRATSPELVPSYLQRLNREEVMKGHAFAELEMRRPEDAEDRSSSTARFVEFRLSTLTQTATASTAAPSASASNVARAQ